MRLSKGVHVLVDGGADWDAALTIPHDKIRVTFAVPWEGMLLLGTTDTLHDGEPETAAVTSEDVEQVLAEASAAVEDIGPVRASFCGLRVLPGGDGETANARRETVFSTGPSGMVSVAGGKLTTYRRIALDALDHLGVRGLSTAPAPAAGRDRPRAHRLAGRARPGDAQSPAAPVRLARGRRARTRLRTTRRCSSRSSPAGPTSARRSCTRARTSGR